MCCAISVGENFSGFVHELLYDPLLSFSSALREAALRAWTIAYISNSISKQALSTEGEDPYWEPRSYITAGLFNQVYLCLFRISQ